MKEDTREAMLVRSIALPDGRYLIFYTFDRESPVHPSGNRVPNPSPLNPPSPETARGSSV